MRRVVACIVAIMAAIVFTGDASAFGDNNDIVVDSEAAKRFANLPKDVRFPEGITANPKNGDIIVGTFNFPNAAAPNFLLRFDRFGKLVAKLQLDIDAPLLGLAYNPDDDKVYFANVGNFIGVASSIRRIKAKFNKWSNVEEVVEIPGIGAPPDRIVENPDTSTDTIIFGQAARVPNALAFTRRGDLYVSDSFQGAIFRVRDPARKCLCSVDDVKTVVHDGLLATPGFPPFGANGLALSKDERRLFVANTGDDRVLTVDLAKKKVDVFAESLIGADGLAMGKDGTLWVAANQGDHVIALNKVGRPVAMLGAFLGIERDGSARGLIFPASLVIVKDKIFVTNLALALRGPESARAEPEADITKYTISRINIPRLRR